MKEKKETVRVSVIRYTELVHELFQKYRNLVPCRASNLQDVGIYSHHTKSLTLPFYGDRTLRFVIRAHWSSTYCSRRLSIKGRASSLKDSFSNIVTVPKLKKYLPDIKMDFGKILILIYDFMLFMVMSVIYICETVILTFIPYRYRGKSIKGEIALVTGGASGIGRLIAKKLSSCGTQVIIWDINKLALEDTVNEIRRSGGKCWGYYCDISDREEVYRIAKSIKIEIGNVSLLINNAGYVYCKTLLDIPDEEIERTFKINILSHYWTIKAFLKDMMKENHGHIVTVASVAGILGMYNCTDYSATKSAAIGFHESLLAELNTHGYDGIHMTLVCPYLINTGMFNGVKPRLTNMLEPEYVAEEVVKGILLNKVNVILPDFSKFILLLKCLLPAKMIWAFMYHVVRGPQFMMMYKGRGKTEILKENNNTTQATEKTHLE